MRKAILLIMGFCLCAGLVMAEGREFQAGAGYYAGFWGPSMPGFLEIMPLGLSAYGGIGYGFGDSQAFSLGFEAAASWGLPVSMRLYERSNRSLQGRIFAKYNNSEIFSITGFGGFNGGFLIITPVFGARITVLSFYFEYAAVTARDCSSVYLHSIGLGFSFVDE